MMSILGLILMIMYYKLTKEKQLASMSLWNNSICEFCLEWLTYTKLELKYRYN
jgi:hypothetical protein